MCEGCEYRKGDATEVAHGCPFSFIDNISFVTTMKRE
jgi:hypothetical protein